MLYFVWVRVLLVIKTVLRSIRLVSNLRPSYLSFLSTGAIIPRYRGTVLKEMDQGWWDRLPPSPEGLSLTPGLRWRKRRTRSCKSFSDHSTHARTSVCMHAHTHKCLKKWNFSLKLVILFCYRSHQHHQDPTLMLHGKNCRSLEKGKGQWQRKNSQRWNRNWKRMWCYLLLILTLLSDTHFTKVTEKARVSLLMTMIRASSEKVYHCLHCQIFTLFK